MTQDNRELETKNKWDSIAERFNTHKNRQKIHPDVAINLYVGWPVFFDQIQKHSKYLGKRTCRILDFGCGTGSFCHELHKKGHDVIGMDSSEKMLQIAKENLPKNIHLMNKEQLDKFISDTDNHESLDIITSIHSLDWIENVAKETEGLLKLLKPEGMLLFGVFPQNHVIDSLKMNDLFEDFDSDTNPTLGYANFEGIKIPVFIRKAEYYDRLFTKRGFEKVLETYPPFPKSFLSKFKWQGSKYPEMMILAYRKDHF